MKEKDTSSHASVDPLLDKEKRMRRKKPKNEGEREEGGK